MKIRFTPPTDEFPFYSNVSIKTPDGFKVIKEYPTDGRPNGPALFHSKEQIKDAAKRLVKSFTKKQKSCRVQSTKGKNMLTSEKDAEFITRMIRDAFLAGMTAGFTDAVDQLNTIDEINAYMNRSADDYVATIVEKTECFMYGDMSLTKPALTLPLSML